MNSTDTHSDESVMVEIPRDIATALVGVGFAAVALSVLVTTLIAVASTGTPADNWVVATIAPAIISVTLFTISSSMKQ